MAVSLDRVVGVVVVVVVALIAVLATSGSAGVTWRGDYESQSFGQWDCKVQEKTSGRATIVSSPVRQGRYAARYEVRPGDNNVAGSGSGERTEAFSCRSFGEGEEQWWAWSTMFAPDFSASDSTWNVITQWHNSGTSGGTLGFVVKGDELRFQSFGGNPSSPTYRSCKIADKANGTWYDIVFHVKWSSNASIGFVEVWVNGTKVVNLTNVPTLYNGQTVYLKQGYYRTAQPNVAVLYHDGMRQGTSYADVAAEFPERSKPSATPGPGITCVPRAPQIMTAPLIHGVTKPGRSLTTTPGRWSHSPTRFSYQWQVSRNGSTWRNLRGLSGRSVVLPTTFSGSKVRVRVTATNSAGSVTATSAPVASRTNAKNPAKKPVGYPAIRQSIRAGQILRGTIIWKATPAVRVKQIDFAMDGNKVNHIDKSPPFAYVVDTTTLADGKHTFGLTVTRLNGTVVWRPYQIGTVIVDNQKS